ncbi:hypothetical protein BH10PLA1_BH10PLA1_23040 [soil metagenome]
MQVLSDATNRQVVSPEQCAEEILDAVPEVMWMLRCHMRKRRAKGLSVPQFRALCLVNKFHGASMSMVSDHLGSTLPTASRIVGGLVTRGLVSRKASTGDRRQVELNLTVKGKSILDVARKGTEAAVAEKLLKLTPQERATMSKSLALMVSVLGRSAINPAELV